MKKWKINQSKFLKLKIYRFLSGKNTVIIELGAGTAVPSIRMLGEEYAGYGKNVR